MNPIVATLCAIVAAVAITSQAHTPPHAFVRGMHEHGRPVASARFVGLRWRCLPPYDDETCYAGLRGGRLVTGP